MTELEKYVDARKSLDRAKEKLDKITLLISEVGAKLTSKFCGISGENISLELNVQGSTKINSMNWPDYKALSDALANWKKANADVEEAWGQVPAEARKYLQEPQS